MVRLDGSPSAGVSLTQVSWGIVVNMLAGSTNTLPRIGTGPGTCAGFVCPRNGKITTMSAIVDNVVVEWLGGTLDHAIYVNGVLAYSTGAKTLDEFTQKTRGGDAVVEAFLLSPVSFNVRAGDLVNVVVIAGATYSGQQDGSVVDLFLQWA